MQAPMKPEILHALSDSAMYLYVLLRVIPPVITVYGRVRMLFMSLVARVRFATLAHSVFVCWVCQSGFTNPLEYTRKTYKL